MPRNTEKGLGVDNRSSFFIEGQLKRYEIPAMLRAAGKCGLTMTVDRRHPDPNIGVDDKHFYVRVNLGDSYVNALGFWEEVKKLENGF